MQSQAMQIATGQAIASRAILGNFASPDAGIAIETWMQNRTILIKCDRAFI